MLRNLNELEQYSIRATDGDIGHVKDFYFDDASWVVRYLVLETGPWLDKKKVLISPISVQTPDWANKVLHVGITMEQVENSPGIDTDKPVSLQYQREYSDYYGYPYYWGGGGMWGAGLYPFSMRPGYAAGADDREARSAAEEAYARVERKRHRNDDPHLRSCKAVIGYHIRATDGDIGHVASMIVDQDTWAIRYIVVDTSNWWIGHKVLIAPDWISGVDWNERTVAVELTRASVQSSPAFRSTDELNRENESELYTHYGRPAYWSETLAMKRP